MNTYLEIIKQAYGDQWEEVEPFVCKHSGWCSDKHYNKINCPLPKDNNNIFSEYRRMDDGERMVDVYFWIPISLLGLEENNDWIKLDETNRIQYEDVWVTNYNANKAIFAWDAMTEIHESYTHYQPIEKPKSVKHNFTREEILKSIKDGK